MADLELVFLGELEAGFSMDQVRANMARLFKANDAQLDRMFSGKPVVLKNGLDAATAEKFRVIIAKQGARVHIRKRGAPLPQDTPSRAQPAVDEAVSDRAAQPNPFFRHLDAAESTASADHPRTDASPTRAAGGSATAPDAGRKAEPPSQGLPLAGDKVDAILQGLDWSLAPPGSDMGEAPRFREPPRPVEPEDWSLAPPGTRLVEPREMPPVPEPDTSQFTLAPLDETKPEG